MSRMLQESQVVSVSVDEQWVDVNVVEGYAVCSDCGVMLVSGGYVDSDVAVFFGGRVVRVGDVEGMVESEWEGLVSGHEAWHAESLSSDVVSGRLSGRDLVARRRASEWESPLASRRGSRVRRSGKTSLIVIEHSSEDAEVTLVEDEFGRDVEVRRSDDDFLDHSSESTVEEFEEWMTHPTAWMRQNDPDAYGVSVKRAMAGLYKPWFVTIALPSAHVDEAEVKSRLTPKTEYRHPNVHDTAERQAARRRFYAAR